MKSKKTCSNCIMGTMISVNNDILCREKGVVSPDYVCSKHRSTPQSKSFKQMNYKCIHCENFIVNMNNAEGKTTVGLCQLFSVRQFDGEEKNACSKFVKRSQVQVS